MGNCKISSLLCCLDKQALYIVRLISSRPALALRYIVQITEGIHHA
jgi:hypothetical protein